MGCLDAWEYRLWELHQRRWPLPVFNNKLIITLWWKSSTPSTEMTHPITKSPIHQWTRPSCTITTVKIDELLLCIWYFSILYLAGFDCLSASALSLLFRSMGSLWPPLKWGMHLLDLYPPNQGHDDQTLEASTRLDWKGWLCLALTLY